MLTALKAGNLAVKFALEIAAIAAFAYWGATIGNGIVSVLLAVAAPMVAIGLWATFAAPKAKRRVRLRWRAPFELGVFALAALALLPASTAATIVFSSAVTINSALLTALGQWDD